MLKISLVNLQIQKNNINNLNNPDNSDLMIFRPTIKNANEYKIIFNSTKRTFIQFNLFVKFTKSLNIFSLNSTNHFDIFPYNGIIYSTWIDKTNNLIIDIDPLDLCAKIIIKKKIEKIYRDIKFTKIYWDNILIINLTRRSDRKEEMIKKLQNANITKYNFLEAYDGKDEFIIETFYKLKEKKNIPIVTSGHFACLLSHIKAIKLAIKNNYDYIMILEDDVFLCDDFVNKLNNLSIPEFDMLYLGGITSRKKFFYTEWAYSNNKIMGAYGYILNKTIFEDVIKGLEKLDEYVDIYYLKSIQANYNTFILNDYIKTDLSSSDTSHKSKKMIKCLSYIK